MDELTFYKEWNLIMYDYACNYFINDCIDKNEIPNIKKDFEKMQNDIIKFYRNGNLKKLKEWFSYGNELRPSPSDKEYPILNARLRAACGKDLRDFDKKRLDKVRKIEERGYIKTNSEYYQIRNHIDYLEATNGTDEEIIKFDSMISLYEEKIREKMEKQKKKRDRQE